MKKLRELDEDKKSMCGCAIILIAILIFLPPILFLLAKYIDWLVKVFGLS